MLVGLGQEHTWASASQWAASLLSTSSTMRMLVDICVDTQPVEVHSSCKLLSLGHFLTLVHTHQWIGQLLGEWTPVNVGPFGQGILST